MRPSTASPVRILVKMCIKARGHVGFDRAAL
jgi:hypothetical protein